ncbi:CRISPR-associated protein Cas5 [Candidatus Syntrophocurvum alkaliphilum]|uniref:CRISPR-associated protein Cas5 n=1 Tax=Candidatus Syntrophocurvum alkaliphilum TaxID=2293317 RepID=A0A6I6DKG3_9FIRM|nr:CRISPR-associated protein Cas5 [Candidatus Syntrophocurvum alkaliphilum]QGT99801.1 CRISPR-associated protein Cas5 [Candidatus Syntrophocurvum alkaliphilum]
MEILVFDLKSSIAHFRMPDTMNTHATYPFIPPTTVRGLAGSIIGLPDYYGKAQVGIRVMSPVRKSVQQLSMLGKGWMGSGDFNRPTSIELLVEPYYRIYWYGEHLDKLKHYLQNSWSHYQTYLGSAFALCFPKYVGTYNAEELKSHVNDKINCATVIPINAIEKLYPNENMQYARVGGLHYEYLGNRTFGKTCSVIYETSGKDISFKKNNKIEDYKFCQLDNGEIVCLW